MSALSPTGSCGGKSYIDVQRQSSRQRPPRLFRFMRVPRKHARRRRLRSVSDAVAIEQSRSSGYHHPQCRCRSIRPHLWCDLVVNWHGDRDRVLRLDLPDVPGQGDSPARRARLLDCGFVQSRFRLSLKCVAVPITQRCSCCICALTEIEQGCTRRRGTPHVVIHQQKLGHVLTIKRLSRMNLRFV